MQYLNFQNRMQVFYWLKFILRQPIANFFC